MTTRFPNLGSWGLGSGGHDRRRLGRLVLPVVVAGVLAGGVAVVPGVSGADASADSTTSSVPVAWALGKVHLHVQTTSDWATIAISGAYLLVRKGTASTNGLQATETGGGWAFHGVGSYDADIVLGVRPTDLQVTVDKGQLGVLQAVFTSAVTSSVLLSVNDQLHGTSGEHPNRQYATVTRSDLNAAVVPGNALPRGDDRRLTLAFAYPWFDSSYSDSKLTEKPSDPRSWFSSAGVLSMTQQAKDNGIDGFVMSYAGESANGASLDRLLAAANQTGSVVSPYLETAIAVQQAGLLGDKQGLVEQWLRSALRRANDPAFLRLHGVPVVFVYQMEKLTVAQWAGIRDSLRNSGLQVVLIGDASDAPYRPLMGGVHAYAATDDIPTLASRSQYASVSLRAASVMDATVTPEISVATVSPGYDDRKTRGFTNPVIPRDGGRRYDDTWLAALSGTPDWIVVTSWNEWYEDTSVEPGTISGGQALQQTKQHAAAFRASTG
jgi:hypothetical protein